MKLTRFAKNLIEGKWVELMHAGTYNRTTFSLADLNAMAENYDPDYRAAPLVIGHPSLLQVEGEREAHGVVSALRVVGDMLQARFDNLTDDVKQKLQTGKLLNRSIEAMKLDASRHDANDHKSDKAQWYLTGLALLGGSQPAVPAMLSDNNSRLCVEIKESESANMDNSQQPLNTKGAAKMEAAELKRLEALEAQAGEVKTIQASIDILADTIKTLATDVGSLKTLKTDYDALSASTSALVDAQAQLAVNKATAGIPKKFCSDEKKARLSTMYKSDRKAFDEEAVAFEAMRGSFAYLTTESVQDGDSVPSGADKNVNAKADERSAKVALKARELRGADKSLSIETSIKLAEGQVS